MLLLGLFVKVLLLLMLAYILNIIVEPLVFVELLLVDLSYSLYSPVSFLYDLIFFVCFSELSYFLYTLVSFFHYIPCVLQWALNQKLWKRLFSELFAVFSHFLPFGKIKIYFLPFGKTNLYYFLRFPPLEEVSLIKGCRYCVRLDLENVLRCY